MVERMICEESEHDWRHWSDENLPMKRCKKCGTLEVYNKSVEHLPEWNAKIGFKESGDKQEKIEWKNPRLNLKKLLENKKLKGGEN